MGIGGILAVMLWRKKQKSVKLYTFNE
ncbi:hypothetical protein [Pelodictyon phaeoclathratiforme]